MKKPTVSSERNIDFKTVSFSSFMLCFKMCKKRLPIIYKIFIFLQKNNNLSWVCHTFYATMQ